MGRSSEVVNPGNTLYVTGLSMRVTERQLEHHFNKEGKVVVYFSPSSSFFFFSSLHFNMLFLPCSFFLQSINTYTSFNLYVFIRIFLYCHLDLLLPLLLIPFLFFQVASCFLVVEPRSRTSRGFAFITMDSVEDANRCIKHLNQSVLEGRCITVERVGSSFPANSSKPIYLVFFFLTMRFSGYIQNTLRQLCWQQSQMMSTSIATFKQLDQWPAKTAFHIYLIN